MDSKLIKLAKLIESDQEDLQECKSDMIASYGLDEATATKVAQAIRGKYAKELAPGIAETLGLDEADVLEVLSSTDEDGQTLDEPEDEDYIIYDSGRLGGKTSVSIKAGRHLGDFSSFGEAEEAIKLNMARDNYWPNVWYQDDHGGVQPYDIGDTDVDMQLAGKHQSNMDPDKDFSGYGDQYEGSMGIESSSKNQRKSDTSQKSKKEGLPSNKTTNGTVDEVTGATRASSSAPVKRETNEKNKGTGRNAQKKSEKKSGDGNMNKNSDNTQKNLVKTAEGPTKNDSKKPFQYSEKAKFNSNREYDKMTLQSDGGNSLKKDTDEFKQETNDLDVYTTNPEQDFLMRDSIQTRRFQGSPDGSLEYTLPAEMLKPFEVPSEGETAGSNFKVPTQLPTARRLTTVAMEMPYADEDEEDTFTPDSDIEGAEVDISIDETDDGGTDEVSFESDMGDSLTEGSSPEDLVDSIDKLDDEELDRFIEGFHVWASENEVDISPGSDSALGGGLDDDMGGDIVDTGSEPDMDGGYGDKETIAKVLGAEFDLDAAEEVLADALESLGVTEDEMSKLTFAQGTKLYKKIKATKKVEIETDEDVVVEAKAKKDDKKDAEASKAAELREARIRTAYTIWGRLAGAGMASYDEVDAHVDTWLESGMSVKAMVQQGNVMLATAKASAKSQRTASNRSNSPVLSTAIATAPAFNSGGMTRNEAVYDLKEALSGIWAKPDLGDNK